MIYLDNAATTPVLPEVIQEVDDCLRNDFGNPSSLHRLGIRSEKKVKEAQKYVSDVLRVEPNDILFTSGGTEANNLAIRGAVYSKRRVGKHCITSSIEHPSVANTFKFLETQGFDVTYLPVDGYGKVSVESVRDALREDTILISIMHVNNETGSIQKIFEIGNMLKVANPQIIFHVDAIQSYGKVPLFPRECGVDLLSISGHKLHSLKGIGALYKQRNVRLEPIIFGGGQQGGLRSGTENVPGIVGLGAAAKWIKGKFDNDSEHLLRLKDLLVNGIMEELPETVINSPKDGAPHILNIAFPGIRGEILLHTLEDEGVYVSTGSACSSHDKGVSHTLKAIGLDDKTADGAIRISTSYLTTEDEINRFMPILVRSVKRVKKFTRR